MKTINDLISGYRRFRAGIYAEQAALYRSLGEGQNPAIMLIACADSRAEPSDIFAAAPGQLFVVRNVANLVPPYMPDGKLHGVSSALEYAVNVLEVQHIVVMGHGGCGGIAASLANEQGNPAIGEFVTHWVKLLDEARARVMESGSVNPQFSLELEGIESSLKNLMTFPFVAKRVEAGTLELHGAWFAIKHGELHWRNAKTGRFEVIEP
ncbi:MAG: carbonic anhydrase [Hyphomonas sp.]|uniref:carbonic anhydrase n=1 Tax=Hyphomonas sp. TaxID=87 RepID=UPI00352933F4